MEYEYKVGQRVVCVSHSPAGNSGIPIGLTGVIRALGRPLPYGVEWETPIPRGHNLGDFRFRNGYCYWVRASDIEPYEEDSRELSEEEIGAFMSLISL